MLQHTQSRTFFTAGAPIRTLLFTRMYVELCVAVLHRDRSHGAVYL